MSSTLSAVTSTFRDTIGAWVIGATVSTGLLGIATLQYWIYYTRFPKDPLILKILAFSIWSLEALRTALCVHAGYYYSVDHWGDFFVLSKTPYWGLGSMVLLTVPIAFLAHLFFAYQIRSIITITGKYHFLFYVVVILSLGDIAFGLASFITSFQHDTFTGIILGLPAHLANGALICAIAVDWTITITLVLFLWNNKGTRTRTLMQTLILYAINFGVLISVTDLVVLIMADVKWPSLNLYQVSLFEVVGNLYVNTVLASLNSRTLVATHLHRPGNLHVSSINVASTQINGFRHPGVSALEENRFHIQTIVRGPDDEGHGSILTESLGVGTDNVEVKHTQEIV